MRKQRERSQFDDAARKVMAGKSRDEAREILIEQFRREDQEIPGGPLLEMRLDLLLAPDTPSEKVRLYIDSVGALARAGGRLKDLFTGEDSGSVNMPPGNILMGPDWSDANRVLLDDDAQDWIGDARVVVVDFRNLSPVSAVLQASGERSTGGQIVVLIDGRRAGVLDDADSGPFWELLTSGPDPSGNRAVTTVFRSKDSDGLWRLDVGGPKNVMRLSDDPTPLD
jgi:hypothetical protein